MTQAYDDNNVFAKILRGEIPNTTILDDEHTLAFHDIQPQRQTHAVVIPKGAYQNFSDFAKNASDEEIVGYIRGLGKAIHELGLEAQGYRLISNCGENGGQEVPHLHVHILGGEPVGALVEQRPPSARPAPTQPEGEIGGQKGPEPTRFGDWEKNGRCTDF